MMFADSPLAGVKKSIDLSKERLQELEQQLFSTYEKCERKCFPYHINEANQVESNEVKNR